MISRFKAKFKSFVEQYEMRELHFYSLLRTKELEVQYNYARFEQQRKHAEAESSRAKALNSQVSTFSQTEAELRSQLNIYVDKFKQVGHPVIYYSLLPFSLFLFSLFLLFFFILIHLSLTPLLG